MAQGGFRGGLSWCGWCCRGMAGKRAACVRFRRGGGGRGAFSYGGRWIVLVRCLWAVCGLVFVAVVLLLQRKEALRGVVSKLGEGLLSTL